MAELTVMNQSTQKPVAKERLPMTVQLAAGLEKISLAMKSRTWRREGQAGHVRRQKLELGFGKAPTPPGRLGRAKRALARRDPLLRHVVPEAAVLPHVVRKLFVAMLPYSRRGFLRPVRHTCPRTSARPAKPVLDGSYGRKPLRDFR